MSTVFTGAKATITIDHQPILWATNVQVTQENKLEEIPQLDDLEVAEYAENGHRISVTIGVLKTNQQALADFGLDSDNVSDILLQPEMLVTIYDNTDNTPKYEISGVKFRAGTGSVDSRGFWIGSWSFTGRRGQYL
jgi:hypothetical protein